MGERGPKPLTAEQLRHRGSHRAKKRREQEAQLRPRKDADEPLTAEQMKPFDDMGEIEKAFWESHVDELVYEGILTRRSYMGFLMLCGVYQDYQDAIQLIHEHGELIKGSRGQLKKNPAIQIREKAFDQFVKLAARFGIVPS